MSRLRIAFVNAAHEGADTRRNFRRELDADLVEFDATGGELPETTDFDGVVVSGSRSSVYWDEEWIEPTKEWVGEAIDAGLPSLGVCWGHQLLADVLGGEVADMGEYEIGYREVSHTGDSRLFDGIDDEFTVFTTHSDAVTELPPGATEIAANDYSNHGFRKERVFGVQFHPEYDAETAESVTKGKELADDRMDEVLAGITDENYRAACEAKLVFENFCDFAREVRERDADPESDGETVSA